MRTMGWRGALLGIGAILIGQSSLNADDTIRLGAKGSIQDGGATISRLDLRGDQTDDTLEAGYRYGYGRGFGGYYGGYGRGFGGYYGGYRGYYGGGFYSGGFSYYRPSFGYGFSYYPRYYAPVYSFGYSYPRYYGGFCGIGGDISIVTAPIATLQIRPAQPMNPIIESRQDPAQLLPPQRVPNQERGTFQYDGGPVNPVPMPMLPLNQDAQPQAAPKTTVPDRAVSIPLSKPDTTKKYQYSAYGEKPKSAVPAKDDKVFFVKGTK